MTHLVVNKIEYNITFFTPPVISFAEIEVYSADRKKELRAGQHSWKPITLIGDEGFAEAMLNSGGPDIEIFEGNDHWTLVGWWILADSDLDANTLNITYTHASQTHTDENGTVENV